MTVARFVERLPNGEVRWELRRDGRKRAGMWRTADVAQMVAFADLMGWELEEVTSVPATAAAPQERLARQHYRGCPDP